MKIIKTVHSILETKTKEERIAILGSLSILGAIGIYAFGMIVGKLLYTLQSVFLDSIKLYFCY